MPASSGAASRAGQSSGTAAAVQGELEGQVVQAGQTELRQPGYVLMWWIGELRRHQMMEVSECQMGDGEAEYWHHRAQHAAYWARRLTSVERVFVWLMMALDQAGHHRKVREVWWEHVQAEAQGLRIHLELGLHRLSGVNTAKIGATCQLKPGTRQWSSWKLGWVPAHYAWRGLVICRTVSSNVWVYATPR